MTYILDNLDEDTELYRLLQKVKNKTATQEEIDRYVILCISMLDSQTIQDLRVH